MQEFDYDLFVLGAGSGGVRACRIAASLGAKVGVAEERYFGGTCVNVGCVPKKLFSYAAHFRDDFEDSKGFGWSCSDVGFDWATLKENKDKEINRLKSIYKSILEDSNVDIFEARATIEGPHEIRVQGKLVTAKFILIAVGGWPWTPVFSGSDLAISSNELFELNQLPGSLVVSGGGYIAVEFASIFSRLGCQTTLVYRGDKLLRGFDEEIRDFITEAIGHGVVLRLNTQILEIRSKHSGVNVLLNDGSEIVADLVLSATGRRPMTSNLGLEKVAVELNKSGSIQVDEHYRTAEPSIYAVGDVIDRIALTPVALAEGQTVARHLFLNDLKAMDYQNIPTAVFCHPNLGTVGLTEEQANEKGLVIEVYSSAVNQLKHSLGGRKELCMIKLIVEKSSDRVIGLHMVGPDAGELVQGFAVAMNCGATKADFDRTIGIHPTLAEEFVTMRSARPGRNF